MACRKGIRWNKKNIKKRIMNRNRIMVKKRGIHKIKGDMKNKKARNKKVTVKRMKEIISICPPSLFREALPSQLNNTVFCSPTQIQQPNSAIQSQYNTNSF